MLPYDRLSDEERRKLVRDFSEAVKRIQADPAGAGAPAKPGLAELQPAEEDRSARPAGLCAAADSLLVRPPWRLRVKIDSYACSRGYAMCGLRQYFASLVSFLSPERDYIHPRFACALIQDRPSPAGPSGYGLERTLIGLERQAAFLLSGGQILKRSSDHRAPLRQAILHDLKSWEPFGFSFLNAFLRFDGEVYRALDAVRARADLQRGVDAFELVPIVRTVFRAVLLTPAGFEEIRRRLFNAGALIQSNYKRAFTGSAQIETICRKIDNGVTEFLGCYARLRWFAHQLYPALLKVLGRFEEEKNLGRILPAAMRFVGLEEKEILEPPGEAPADGGGEEPGGKEGREAASPPAAAPVPVGEEYRGILTALGYAFPGSRIEALGENDASALFWFHQKIWSKERARPGTPGRKAGFSELLWKISRRDPLAPLILLYEILSEMLAAVDPQELGRLTRPEAMAPQAFQSRFEEIRRRWLTLRANLFERYLQEVDFYEKELSLSGTGPAGRFESSIMERRAVETINQIRNHAIRGYGWTAMGWDRTAVFKCEPLYDLVARLYELLGELAMDRGELSRENPVYVSRFKQARFARLDDGPILRQIGAYIQALPQELRLLKNPQADAQRSFLEILLGTVDLLDFLVNDPRSFLRGAEGRVLAADAEDREIRSRIRQDATPLRVEMRKDFEEVDRLTGLLAKNYYLREAPRLFAAALNAGESLSMLILDLDHFKAINDSLGHAFGDEILKAAAQVVLSSMREEDLAVRFGGEELLVVVRGDCRAAFAQGERIRLRLNEILLRNFPRELAEIPEILARKEAELGAASVEGAADGARRLDEAGIAGGRDAPPAGRAADREAILRRWLATPIGTASVGVAQGLGAGLPRPAEREADLLVRADRMLYLAKDSGRNRVVGMVDRLRLPLLYEEFADLLLYGQEYPQRAPESFIHHREATGRPLRFAPFDFADYLKSR